MGPIPPLWAKCCRNRIIHKSSLTVAMQRNRAFTFKPKFAAVVLAALDDAIADDKKYGNGPEQIMRWARSRDGREVLMCAGIEPNERCIQGMVEFVNRGIRTSVALSREESERQAAA